MRTPRFYEPQALTQGQELNLSDTVTQHVSRALRMRPGDHLILFNGDGCEYRAELTEVAKRTARALITEITTTHRQSPLKVTLGQSVSRGERMDYAIQKATELGMHQMVPLFSERCEVRLNPERQEKRRQHWQQVAVSACEQSLRCDVPEIAAPQSLTEWINSVEADLKLVLHHHTAQPLGEFDKPTSVALLIGPEGGLSETEVEQALAQGFKPVAFGPRVFRTETAPVAALSVLQYLWGDLG
ncbi:16S rRNA (uracil(1498)-N(3))-methyltransferase [Amphritea japonica]|uniref:Ribosomal RNA small subunit methyltransferase E n=1 Tax=Amphritea japonica ATCC BAA-1530 TaxID=1278309 RepID=A0A7R6PED9_9GAMM|nr:16S rRNA (uracil(1498)-N(3))-methyltransferase [Amphritea japonica]BBB24852.1 16S rRNA (uracil1498-N3)-methyltransferase [Amphritea japonica ATCC BAA-1530]